jgi:hypothetical protein
MEYFGGGFAPTKLMTQISELRSNRSIRSLVDIEHCVTCTHEETSSFLGENAGIQNITKHSETLLEASDNLILGKHGEMR